MKKKFAFFIIIITVVSTLFVFGNNPKNTIATSKKIYIYDSWKNDITSYKDDSILYQFAIYDFNNEIDIEKSNLIDLNLINSNDNMSLTDFDLEYTGEENNIKFYTLSVYITLDKLGIYNLNNIDISMELPNNNQYTFSLGNSIVNIINKNNDLDLVEGSAILSKKTETDIYDVDYTIKNLTDKQVTLVDIKLNDQSGIEIIESNVSNLKINPNEEKKINLKLKLDKNINNSLISFNLIYDIDKEKKEYATSPVIIADPVPIERLNELIKSN